jgi:predicted HTH domain antitoxin
MKMTDIKFKIPEEILNALNQDKVEFTKQSRLYTALQLFKNHKLSFGKAAELAGLSKDEFLIELDKNNIDYISYNSEELKSELKRF